MAQDDFDKPNPDLQMNELSRQNPTRSHNESGLAGTSPGMVDIFKAGEWDLLQVAEKRGIKLLEITKVRVANVKGESRVWLYPTRKGDPAGIKVKRYDGKLRINLGPHLTRWELALPQGRREWFHLIQADAPESPVGPALYFDLDKPYKTRPLGGKGGTAGEQAAAGTEPQTPESGSEQEA